MSSRACDSDDDEDDDDDYDDDDYDAQESHWEHTRTHINDLQK